MDLLFVSRNNCIGTVAKTYLGILYDLNYPISGTYTIYEKKYICFFRN